MEGFGTAGSGSLSGEAENRRLTGGVWQSGDLDRLPQDLLRKRPLREQSLEVDELAAWVAALLQQVGIGQVGVGIVRVRADAAGQLRGIGRLDRAVWEHR